MLWHNRSMKIYRVGGAVRDKLLGRAVKDIDYAVVGATVGEMLRLGYRAVGKDLPVFLHPKTNEEYALARTERKPAPGYHGFAFNTDPSVTLEDDLGRRDLTINAMAREEDGTLVDPHGGQRDLAKGCRHLVLCVEPGQRVRIEPNVALPVVVVDHVVPLQLRVNGRDMVLFARFSIGSPWWITWIMK